MKIVRKLSITFIAIAFTASILSGIVYRVRDAAERAEYFQEQETARREGRITFSGPYCYPDKHPQFLLILSALTGLGLTFSAFKRLTPLGVVPCFAALGFYWYWYSRTQYFNSILEDPHAGINVFFERATIFDFVAVVSLAIGTAILSAIVIRSAAVRLSPIKLP